MSNENITARLEYLRGEIRAERISYGEIAELQDLVEHIPAGDVELLEWAGVPEHPEDADSDDREGWATDKRAGCGNVPAMTLPSQVCSRTYGGCPKHWSLGYSDGKAGLAPSLLPPIHDGRANNPCLAAYHNGYYRGRQAHSTHRPDTKGTTHHGYTH